MNKEQMTVHKALAELKIIDNRISKAIRNGVFVHSCKNGVDKIDGVPVSDFKNNISSDYQKAIDLINRRNAIKRAVVLSNATTKVIIGNKEYTVAEAIEMKNHGMDGLKMLLNELVNQCNKAVLKFNQNSGEELERKAEQYAILHDAYVANNEFMMIDPLDIVNKIDDIDKTIDEFNAEIDSCLSVSNAITIIEFEY